MRVIDDCFWTCFRGCWAGAWRWPDRSAREATARLRLALRLAPVSRFERFEKPSTSVGPAPGCSESIGSGDSRRKWRKQCFLLIGGACRLRSLDSQDSARRNAHWSFRLQPCARAGAFSLAELNVAFVRARTCPKRSEGAKAASGEMERKCFGRNSRR